MKGFLGNLDKLVPELIKDPIYSTARLHRNSKLVNLGNIRDDDTLEDEQYKWWNSETQSNWWDGYIRHALMLNDVSGIEKVHKYIKGILSTQDDDGYLGIYTKDLRYNFRSENGELWAKATLYRGLLAYYEYTLNNEVWDALVFAVDNVMQNYPIGRSSPFDSGVKYNGGVSHGLTFTDVLDKMYQLTGHSKYAAYARFLYEDFSKTYQAESDAQLQNILDPEYKLQSHAVHTFEHIRPLAVAAYSSDDEVLLTALQVYLNKIEKVITPTGGAIGDEWIRERQAHSTDTGYEYCSLHELLHSYSVLLQKTGESHYADAIENIFFNAARGSRNPHHASIAYLKTDNSFEMMGTRNGQKDAHNTQTRYKYSPAHQDVAVCCVPNAGRISPYFLQACWMKEYDHTLVASLLISNKLETKIHGQSIRIECTTNYPHNHCFVYSMHLEKATCFTFKIRKPHWATSIETNENYRIQENYIVIEREFQTIDAVHLQFDTKVRIISDINGEKYFAYGAQVFARPIIAREIIGRKYLEGFEDIYYEPLDNTEYAYVKTHRAHYENGKITAFLNNLTNGNTEQVELVPLCQTILRQAAFMEQSPD